MLPMLSGMVPVSWFPPRDLQQWVGGDESQGWNSDAQERPRDDCEGENEENLLMEKKRQRRQGVNPQSLDLEYLQCIETGHAADALRDGAGELVVFEGPAAVGSWWQP